MEKIKKIKNRVVKFFNKINNLWENFINLKIMKKIFLFLPHNLFLFLLFLLSVVLIVKNNFNSYIPVYNYENVASIASDPIIDQSFHFSLENIKPEDLETTQYVPDHICIKFGTYIKKVKSEYKYIVHQQENILYEENFKTNTIEDGQFRCFYLPNTKENQLEEYSIEIAPVKTDKENAIAVFLDAETKEAAFSLSVLQPFFSINTVIVLLFLLFFLAIQYMINKKKWSVEKFWLLLSLFYILPITFINPPYEVPDEPRHFYTAYRLTQIDFSKKIHENMENMDLFLPESIGCLNYAAIQVRNKVVNFNDVKNCLQNHTTINKTSWFAYVEAKIAFLTSALGIKLADLFTDSSLIIFYMGRLFNTLFSVFLIYKALKIAPKHKELLLLGATMPMFIQQLASYSYDSYLNSFCIFAIALMLKLIYDKDNNWKIITLLLALSGMYIANIKIIYLPIFLLLLFIPNEKWQRKGDKYIYCGGILLLSYLLKSITYALFETGDFKTILASLSLTIVVGLFIKMLFNQKANWKLVLPIVIVSEIILCFTKVLFTPIPILFYLLLKNPFKKIKKQNLKWLWKIGIPILFLIICGGVFILFKMYSKGQFDSKFMIKMCTLFFHPWDSLLLFYATLKMRGVFYLRSLVGYFGWFNFHLNDIYVISYFILFIYLIKNTQFVKTEWWNKCFIFMGILIGIFGVFLAMYVYWSPADLFYIDGVQGRYFIPFIIPVAFLLMTSKKKRENKNVSKNVISYINIILLEYVSLLLLFYY